MYPLVDLERRPNVATNPERRLDLFQRKALAQLPTLMPDGSLQVSRDWVDFDGRHILIDISKGCVKDKNMLRDPRFGLDLLDPENSYRHLSVRGGAADITEQSADALAHINKLAKKYLGRDKFPYRGPGEIRVIYKIEPERAHALD